MEPEDNNVSTMGAQKEQEQQEANQNGGLAQKASNARNAANNVKNTANNVKKAALDNEKIKEVIAKVEDKMGDDGRVLVRPSGTEDLLRVMAEAPTKEEVHDYVMQIVAVVEEEMGVSEA